MLSTISKVTKSISSIPYINRVFFKVFRPVRERLKIEKEVISEYNSGIKIRLNLSDHLESKIFWQGVLDGDIGEFIKVNQLLESDSVFVDVGAHVGVFTLIAADLLSEGTVYSFEPLSEHHKRLKYNVNINDFENVVMEKTIVSNSTEEKTLKVPVKKVDNNPHTKGSGSSSIYESSNSDNLVEYGVPSTKLDKYVEEKGIEKVDIIKIDVEGAELDVLNGGAKTIERFRPTVLMEVDLRLLERANRAGKDVIDFWHQRHYSVYRIEHDGSLSRISSADQLDTRQNILADPGTVRHMTDANSQDDNRSVQL